MTTSYIYDENNRLVKQINPNLSEINFTYDLFDRITKSFFVKTTSDTATENYTEFSYDKS
ncbi:hypothetical protein GW891_05495 [bacterium]|nr:hypothetical protein [bacterium]